MWYMRIKNFLNSKLRVEALQEKTKGSINEKEKLKSSIIEKIRTKGQIAKYLLN